MAVAALILAAVWLLLAFGLRAIVQVRRTGDTGFRFGRERAGSPAWWARLLFVLALLSVLLAPALDLSGLAAPVDLLDSTAVAALGVGLAVAGVLATLGAQVSMGDSWRIGVDPTERTTLVTAGPFQIVRNPIFSAMGLTAVGLTLMVPNPVALIGLGALIVALELQVRVVEEPYLRRTHGRAYEAYAAAIGRFVPGVGRWA